MDAAVKAELLRIARKLDSLPGVYIICDSNHMRIIQLLWQDARTAADDIRFALEGEDA